MNAEQAPDVSGSDQRGGPVARRFVGVGRGGERLDMDPVLASFPERERALVDDPTLVILDVLTEPDECGRAGFVAHWWGYRLDLGRSGLRSQVYWADPAVVGNRFAASGRTVQILLPGPVAAAEDH